MRLRCLNCSAELRITPITVACPACKQQWPTKQGIPRFFQPRHYWGEIPQAEALSFLKEAEELGWREAAVRRLQHDPGLLASVIDKRRTSWFPLLGLGSDAVALDIGSGYGAITQSLATVTGKVYSLEAMPERIEFTRLRLSQEKIDNVHQIQATALDPPFFDRTFDLIVVNGVLEWVGEWQQEGNPRDIQLRFLQKLSQLVKDNGVIVIGIENRFGYWQLRGVIDHSGIPYTSLMPRRVASFYLRYMERAHHRTTLNPRREYRTFTYSARGYRRLLQNSGFSGCDVYWSDPGYNEPYHVVPAETVTLRDYLQSKISQSSPTLRGNARWWLKTKLKRASLVRPFIPDFIIFAERSPTSSSGCHRLLDHVRASLPQVSLPSGAGCMLAAGRTKSVIQVFDKKKEALLLIVKAASPASGDESLLRSEFRNLQLMNAVLERQSEQEFSLPVPLGLFHIGRLVYTAESAAKGMQLSRVLFLKPESQRFRLLLLKLPGCCNVAVQIAQLMRGNCQVKEVEAAWWRVPEETELAIPFELKRPRLSHWAHHGDLTVENVFLEPITGRLSVIDWEHMMRGAPILYDLFTLLVSALPATPLRRIETEGMDELPGDVGEAAGAWQARFLKAFFGEGTAAGLFRDLLINACNNLQVPLDEIWEQFLQFLVLRIHYYDSTKSGYRELHRKFLHLALKNSEDFIIRDENTGSSVAVMVAPSATCSSGSSLAAAAGSNFGTKP